MGGNPKDQIRPVRKVTRDLPVVVLALVIKVLVCGAPPLPVLLVSGYAWP